MWIYELNVLSYDDSYVFERKLFVNKLKAKDHAQRDFDKIYPGEPIKWFDNDAVSDSKNKDVRRYYTIHSFWVED